MQLTMLGVGEAFDADHANSAALVEHDGFTLLIDCGYSAVPPLWRARPGLDALQAIYLTHHHADHVLGLVPMMDRWVSQGRQAPLTVLTTAAGIEHIERLLATMGLPNGADCPFPLHLAVAAEAGAVGPFTLALAPTVHAVPNHAIRLEAGGRALAYSGDGRPTAESRALYAGVDLLMHECFEAEAAPDSRFHCDLPTVDSITGPARVGLYHVRTDQRAALRDRVQNHPRLFLAEAGAPMPC